MKTAESIVGINLRDDVPEFRDHSAGATVSIENVQVKLAGQWILKGVSLLVEPGECVAILGSSGCGKSTLLKTVIGLVEPLSGLVKINGQRMCQETAQQLRREIGYCVQDGGLFPHLTNSENITLMAKIMKWSQAKIQERLEELRILTRMKSEIMDRYPFQISGGQRQRVSLIRSLFLDPGLILLDEPMGALDPIVRCELQEDLKGIFHKLKKTVLLVTHDLSEAAFLGKTILVMKDGLILQEGKMVDLISNPKDPFVTQFVRSQRSHLAELSL